MRREAPRIDSIGPFGLGLADSDQPSRTNSYPVPWTWTSLYRHAPSELRLIPQNVRTRDYLRLLRLSREEQD